MNFKTAAQFPQLLTFAILTFTFPSIIQFVHVEAINVDIDDWVFGCNAIEVHGNQRYW